jgi:hypothetical protein
MVSGEMGINYPLWRNTRVAVVIKSLWLSQLLNTARCTWVGFCRDGGLRPQKFSNLRLENDPGSLGISRYASRNRSLSERQVLIACDRLPSLTATQ